jgi:hypothetical protein
LIPNVRKNNLGSEKEVKREEKKKHLPQHFSQFFTYIFQPKKNKLALNALRLYEIQLEILFFNAKHTLLL